LWHNYLAVELPRWQYAIVAKSACCQIFIKLKPNVVQVNGVNVEKEEHEQVALRINANGQNAVHLTVRFEEGKILMRLAPTKNFLPNCV